MSKARDCVQQSRQRLEDLDAIARDEVLEEIEDVEEELMAAEGRVAAKEAAEQSNAVCVCLCVCARVWRRRSLWQRRLQSRATRWEVRHAERGRRRTQRGTRRRGSSRTRALIASVFLKSCLLLACCFC